MTKLTETQKELMAKMMASSTAPKKTKLSAWQTVALEEAVKSAMVNTSINKESLQRLLELVESAESIMIVPKKEK